MARPLVVLSTMRHPDRNAIEYTMRHSDRNILDMGTTVINIRVGPEPSPTEFTIHENLLRTSSPFFEAALRREPGERVVRLPTSNANAFWVYNQWLYTSRLHTRSRFHHPSHDEQMEEWDCLVGAYLLGEHLQDITFRDSVMDAMQEWAQDCNTMSAHVCENVTKIYGSTSSASPLRHLVTDLTVWRKGNEFWAEQQGSQFPPEFIWGLATGLWTRFTGGGSLLVVDEPFERRRGTCYYHCHRLQPCYRGTHRPSAAPRLISSIN